MLKEAKIYGDTYADDPYSEALGLMFQNRDSRVKEIKSRGKRSAKVKKKDFIKSSLKGVAIGSGVGAGLGLILAKKLGMSKSQAAELGAIGLGSIVGSTAGAMRATSNSNIDSAKALSSLDDSSINRKAKMKAAFEMLKFIGNM